DEVVVSDPLRVIWQALEAHGYRPRGKTYDFRARCPVHNGENRDSLHVGVGADGRALVHCFAHGCDVEAIADALGLGIADFFPDGHVHARRYPSKPLKRSDFNGPAQTVASVLYALERLGEPWRVMLASDCPYCGTAGAWLHARSRGTLLPNG